MLAAGQVPNMGYRHSGDKEDDLFTDRYTADRSTTAKNKTEQTFSSSF